MGSEDSRLRNACGSDERGKVAQELSNKEVTATTVISADRLRRVTAFPPIHPVILILSPVRLPVLLPKLLEEPAAARGL